MNMQIVRDYRHSIFFIKTKISSISNRLTSRDWVVFFWVLNDDKREKLVSNVLEAGVKREFVSTLV